MATPKEGNAADRFPVARAVRATVVITAARRTDGDGLTRRMKKASAKATINQRVRPFTPTLRQSAKTKAATIARFAPLTAVKCVYPVARICVVNSTD